MPNQPLQPFSQSSGSLFTYLNLSSNAILVWVLAAVFLFWLVYTLVAIYHWLTYSHASWVALPAIATHLVVSVVLIIYVLSGSASFLSPFLP